MENFSICTEGEIKLDLTKLCRELNSRSRRRFVPGEPINFPKDDYNPFKEKYDAYSLIKKVHPKNIVLTDKELFMEGMNYVNGISYENKSIVSVHDTFTDNNHILSFERALKEVLHQLGYLSGLTKCPDRSCIMAASDHVKKIDEKNLSLCHSCEIKLAEKQAVI